MAADLHCHSRLSDGSLSVEEIVFFARREGLDFLALTDHDTMAGVTQAQTLGRKYGLTVIPGVEITCRDAQSGKPVHLLCYLPKEPERLETLLRTTLERRTAAGEEMLRLVMQKFPLTREQALKYSAQSKSIYRVHLMHALIDLGYADRFYGELYENILGEHGSCRRHFTYPTLDEALSAVAEARGIPVIAHPGEGNIVSLCGQLARDGRICGVEVFHPRNNSEVRAQLLELCRTYDLIASGGTDFHGGYTPRPNPLGTCTAAPDAVERLFRIQEKL